MTNDQWVVGGYGAYFSIYGLKAYGPGLSHAQDKAADVTPRIHPGGGVKGTSFNVRFNGLPHSETATYHTYLRSFKSAGQRMVKDK